MPTGVSLSEDDLTSWTSDRFLLLLCLLLGGGGHSRCHGQVAPDHWLVLPLLPLGREQRLQRAQLFTQGWDLERKLSNTPSTSRCRQNAYLSPEDRVLLLKCLCPVGHALLAQLPLVPWLFGCQVISFSPFEILLVLVLLRDRSLLAAWTSWAPLGQSRRQKRV